MPTSRGITPCWETSPGEGMNFGDATGWETQPGMVQKLVETEVRCQVTVGVKIRSVMCSRNFFNCILWTVQ